MTLSFKAKAQVVMHTIYNQPLKRKGAGTAENPPSNSGYPISDTLALFIIGGVVSYLPKKSSTYSHAVKVSFRKNWSKLKKKITEEETEA